MANNRELSQLGSFINIDDTTKNIGIATTATPFVGIGTTNPTTKLHVIGDTRVSGVVTTQHLNVTGFTTVVNQSVTGILTVSNGIQGIGIQSAGFNISVGVITAINFVGAGNSFSYNASTKTVDVNIGGSQWTFVDPGSPTTSSIYRVNGNVGLGTTNPTAKLNVVDNSSSDALRITQLGGGNALVVEDDTNPDASPFVIDASGFVGVGTITPSSAYKLNVHGSTNAYIQITNDTEGVGATRGLVLGYDSSANRQLINSWSLPLVLNTSVNTAPVVIQAASLNRRVGIGSTQPNNKLDVIGGAYVSGNLGIGETNPGAKLHVLPTTTGIAGLFSGTSSDDMVRITQLGTGNALVVEDSANPDSTPFVVNASGSVGVGTITPGTKLDVSGIGRFTANGATLNLVGTDHSYIEWFPDGTAAGRKAYTGFPNSGANYFEIANEIAGGGGHIYLNPGTSAAVLISSFTSTGTTLQTLQVTGGAYVSGNVGVGSTNPLQKLHVLGNVLVAAGNSTGQHITQKPYELNNGTLSWEGSAGQLFSITNNLTTGSIFSVNDVSGIPSIDVDANGTVSIAPFGSTEYVGIGTTAPTSKLTVNGDTLITGILTATNGLQGEAFESYEIDLIGYTGYHLRTEETTITFTQENGTTTDFELYNVTVTLPIEDSGLTEDSTFVPFFDGEVVPIENPFRLMITVNGVLQSAFINNTDYVYQSNFLGSCNGYTIDSDNNIKFTESIPTGSDIVARVLPVSNTATKIKNYPFKPTDILLGY